VAGNITVKAFVTDGAPTPSGGSGTAYFSALARPAPDVVTNIVYENRTVYQNQTTEVAKPGMMDSTLGYGLLIVGLAAGVVAGAILMRRGRGKSPSSAGETPPATKEEEKKADEKKKDEGWG
jgi:hypothetical protein